MVTAREKTLGRRGGARRGASAGLGLQSLGRYLGLELGVPSSRLFGGGGDVKEVRDRTGGGPGSRAVVGAREAAPR